MREIPTASDQRCDDCGQCLGYSCWHLGGKVVCDGCKIIMRTKIRDEQIAALTAERDQAIAQGSHNLELGEAQVRIMRAEIDKAEAEIARLRGLVEAAYEEGFSDAIAGGEEAESIWEISNAKRALEQKEGGT